MRVVTFCTDDGWCGFGMCGWGGGSVFRLAKSASRNKSEGGIIKKAARHI